MLSIVEHPSEPKLMNVYARIRGDIERNFPEADVFEAIGGDYRFRTSLPRERVAQAISLRLMKVDYTVFGDAIDEQERANAYVQVWSAMYDEQQRRYGPVPLESDTSEKPAPKYVLEDARFSLEPLEEEFVADAES
jgi:hypothetical protein